MKRKMYYLVLFLSFLYSCSNNKAKNESILETIQETVIQKELIQAPLTTVGNTKKEVKYIFPRYAVDSIIGEYHIFYETLTNVNELISSSNVTEVTFDTLYYAGSDIQLYLEKNRKRFFQRRITKNDFAHYIGNQEISKYSIGRMYIEGVKGDSVCFSLNLCKPDSDICYDFEIYIRENGEFIMNEVNYESELFN
jgi:hypothetical protein